jgi:hypothetical protein
MRAIAQHGKFGIQIRPQRSQGMGDGSVTITQEGIYAQFVGFEDGGVIYEVEQERALNTFPFRGRYQHIDEATPADIAYRLSVFDTDTQNYDPETKLLVEQTLLGLEASGDFFIATEKPLEAPFPNWDTSELPAYQLVAAAVEMGFDLQDILSYERVFGPKREAVIEALEETLKDRQVEEIPA